MLDKIFAQEYDRPAVPLYPYDSLYGTKRTRVREAPVILWTKEYDSDPKKFLDLIQDISNCLLLNGPSLYDEDNPNHSKLFDVAKGKIDPKEYQQFEYAFGDKGSTPIRDNHFFYSAKNHSISEIVKQPFRFSCKNIDNEFTRKKILKDEKTTRKLLKTAFAEAMAQDGINMDHLRDPSINLERNHEDLMNQLYGQEQLELVIYKLLQNINYDHNILNIAKKAFDNKLDVNAEFAFINVINEEVVPENIHPNHVRWISGTNIDTLEDPSVIACSIMNYRTLNEILNTYKHKLNTGTGSRGLLDAFDKLMDTKQGFNYDPTHRYFSETYRLNHLTSDPYDFNDDRSFRMGQVDYMKNMFYPFRKGAYSIGYTILEHKMFFKVQRPTAFVVEINGKTPTEKEFKKWRDEIDNRDMYATFQELGLDEKRPKGAYVIDKYKEEMWQATQLGHRTLIDVRPYEYSIKNKKANNYVGFPIIAQISRQKSTVLVGENINRYCNILIQKVEEILQQAGLSTALLIDESMLSGADALTTLYNAKKSGILMFNSSRYAGGTAFKQQHFQTLKIGHHLEEMERMLAAIGMFNEMYNRMVGSSQVALGAGNNYDSTQKTQLNIANQSQLKADNFYEHNQFMNQVLQRMADIAKTVYSRDGIKPVMLSSGEREVLRLTKDLNLGDYDIYLESGDLAKNKKGMIDQAVMQVLSSGGIDMFEPLINILMTDDPNTALAIFREAKNVITEKEQRAAEVAQQQAMAMAQIQAQKNQVPIQVQGLKNQGSIQVAQIRTEDQRERENFKGTMSDIEENNKRDNMLLENELEMDQETHRAGVAQIANSNNPQTQPTQP